MSFVDLVGTVLSVGVAVLVVAMVAFVPLAIVAAILQAALGSGSRQSRPPQYRPGPRQRRNDRWSSGSDWTYNGGYASGGYAGGSAGSWSDGGSSSSCDCGSSSSSSCGGGSSSSCGGGGSC
ncbi:hypothetical protein AB0I35_01945 [Nocardia sp. NPDC050378]|uniref:hypothetical protein n=1 Tax=Nocardia sp. NPDC050378 TaxID=3155400 RepID=UPI0033F0F8E2